MQKKSMIVVKGRGVIPAKAGIQAVAPEFQVSPCSPGMTGCHKWAVLVELCIVIDFSLAR